MCHGQAAENSYVVTGRFGAFPSECFVRRFPQILFPHVIVNVFCEHGGLAPGSLGHTSEEAARLSRFHDGSMAAFWQTRHPMFVGSGRKKLGSGFSEVGL